MVRVRIIMRKVIRYTPSMWRGNKNLFRTKPSARSGMKSGKRKHSFIENDTSRDMRMHPEEISRHLKPLCMLLYPRKNTLFRTEFKFFVIVRMKFGPITSTPKSMKSRLFMKKCFYRRRKIEDFGGHTINKINSRKKSLIPIIQRHAWASKARPISTM